MNKIKLFVKEHKNDILVAAATIGTVFVGCKAVKFIYNLGGMRTVNQLLEHNMLHWADGMPVISKTGKMISGDPNWAGQSVLVKGSWFVDRVNKL